MEGTVQNMTDECRSKNARTNDQEDDYTGGLRNISRGRKKKKFDNLDLNFLFLFIYFYFNYGFLLSYYSTLSLE